jgi:hypothetical protein
MQLLGLELALEQFTQCWPNQIKLLGYFATNKRLVISNAEH